uniref:Uncharacterized protein n=1 Tax=Ananas comosus var. bracteatus TaxID=296719 RepID=A0A6V7QV45_ANACO
MKNSCTTAEDAHAGPKPFAKLGHLFQFCRFGPDFFTIGRKYPFSFSFCLFFFSFVIFLLAPTLLALPSAALHSSASTLTHARAALLRRTLPASPSFPALLRWLASSFLFVLACERLTLLPFIAILASLASSSPPPSSHPPPSPPHPPPPVADSSSSASAGTSRPSSPSASCSR